MAIALVGPLLGAVPVGSFRLVEVAGAAAVALSAVVLLLAVGSVSSASASAFALLRLGLFTIVLPALLTMLVLSLGRRDVSFELLYTSAVFLIPCAAIVGAARLHEVTVAVRIYRFAGLLHLLAWVATGLDQRFVGLSTNKNVVGGTALAVALILVAKHEQLPRRLVASTFGVAIALAFAASSRTSLILLVAAAAIIYSDSVRAQVTRRRVLGIALAIAVLVVPAYIGLDRLPGFEFFDAQARRFTGTGLLTGRQSLWIESINVLGEYWATGSSRPFERVFTDKSLHSHNLFLDRAHQTGVLGLFGLLWFFLSLGQFRTSKKVAVRAVLLLLIIHQSFEVNIGAGGVPVGLAFAVALGVGLRERT